MREVDCCPPLRATQPRPADPLHETSFSRPRPRGSTLRAIRPSTFPTADGPGAPRAPYALVVSLAVAVVGACGSGSDTTTGPDSGGPTPNTSPSADLTHSPSGPSTGQTVTIDASASSDPDGSLVEYRWDFDGDGTNDQTTSGPTVDFSYSAAGTYEATVAVVDDDGATDDASTTVDLSG